MSELTPLETEKRNELKCKKPLVYDKVMKYNEKYLKGESIAIIQFQYDYRCNFHCQHCSVSDFRRKKDARFFTIPDVKEFFDQADEAGLAHVAVTGGEPTVFPDLDEPINAIDPARFHIQSDTNGWLMTDERAQHLKDLGVDKIQLSLDNLSPEDHDSFRRKPGSWERAVKAIDSIQKAGLSLQIATVVTHQRARSDEFLEFLEFAKARGAAVSVVWPKPVGEWAGKFDSLITAEDIAYVADLSKNYTVYDHLTPAYGLDIGCIAVKRMISVTKYGDVLPCPWMYFSLGNFFEEPLKDILQRGMKYFGEHVSRCRVSEDREFIEQYVAKTYGKNVPVPIAEIFTEDTAQGRSSESDR